MSRRVWEEKTYSIDAPAKLNLHLEILQKRPDGFHDIRSVFQMVSLYDRLTVIFQTQKTDDTIEGNFSFDPGKNTIIDAIRLFRRETSIARGISVKIQKKIPMGGGLGGGSSDGAALLRLLNHVFGFPLRTEKILALGAEIGSDVPFFLTAASAFVSGWGERIEPLDVRHDCVFLLAVPDLSIGTTDAYRWFDGDPSRKNRGSLPKNELMKMIQEQPPEEWSFFNSFRDVLAPRYPVYGILHHKLMKAGAAFAGLSGSGAAYFGVFSSRTAAQNCKEDLREFCVILEIVESVRELPRIMEE
jgi:4-diphosphocytidyl-2-C-methyl-D-erythritol kinase